MRHDQLIAEIERREQWNLYAPFPVYDTEVIDDLKKLNMMTRSMIKLMRAMNMTYESIKEKGALMVIPSSMTESMNSVVGMASAAFKNVPEEA